MANNNTNLSEGVTVEEIEESVISEFENSQKGNPNGFVRLQPFNQVFPRSFLADQKRCFEFPVRDDDIWISSFPKCGETLNKIVILRRSQRDHKRHHDGNIILRG